MYLLQYSACFFPSPITMQKSECKNFSALFLSISCQVFPFCMFISATEYHQLEYLKYITLYSCVIVSWYIF